MGGDGFACVRMGSGVGSWRGGTGLVLSGRGIGSIPPGATAPGRHSWHERPELAAMDQGLQRLGDLTLVLVERVEHFVQLVAPAVDLEAEVLPRQASAAHGRICCISSFTANSFWRSGLRSL